MEKTIDAKGRAIGRVATEAAVFLMGKNSPEFVKNKVSGNKVKIINASKVKVTVKKMEQKIYSRYSGYPGGLKQLSMKHTVDKKGFYEIFREAVYGMLPGNKLRPEIMKNLTIIE